MGEEAPGGGKGRVAGGAKRSKKKIGTQKGTTATPPPPPPPPHRRRREKEVEVKKEEEDEEDALGGPVSKRTTRRTASTENVEAMNASAVQGGGGGGAGRNKKKASPPSPEIVEPKEEEVTEEEEEGEEGEEEDMEIDDEEDAQRGVRKIDADEKYEADWTDKKQYFPIDLAVFDARRRTEEISLNDVEKEKESDVNESKEENKEENKVLKQRGRSIAQMLEDMRASRGEKLVAWQLPPDLPLANKRNGSNRNSTARRNNNTNRRGSKRMDAERVGVGNATNNSDRSKKRKKLLEAADLRAGQLGEIEVYADGTAKLVIGECRFDLENGVSYRHHEQFVVIDEKKKKCAFIGDIVGRVVATPDVDQLIEQSLKDDSGDDDDDDDDDSEVDIAIRNGYND